MLLFFAITLQVQAISRKEYISMYSSLAIREMQNYGIPASITMAQGILESDNGNSYLAVEANNHFGIKCHEWTGPFVNKDDDTYNECFRKYDLALHSYEDHSAFLTTRSRYAFLFDYDPTDYKAWAKGLKKAGYATNPHYPDLLIKIIEDNSLFLLDEQALAINNNRKSKPTVNVEVKKHQKIKEPIIKQLSDEVFYTDKGTRYIIANDQVSIEQLAHKYDLHVWELYKYNDMLRVDNFVIADGQRIYIDKKRSKASRGTPPYKVQQGETMHDISQYYGIKLKSLYHLNRMSVGTQPVAGTYIYLHKRVPKK